MRAAQKLRALLQGQGPILAPGAYDCLSARAIERAGFSAGFISGAAVTASVLGYPDVGLQTMPEILNQSRNMARAVNIPLIVDVDTGYGNALNVMRTVREFEDAGLAGIFIEDQTFPKRCGHFEGKNVISVKEMTTKIQAACDMRASPDFVIIARTDSRALHGLDDAIVRANEYAKAGADVVFIESLLSREEMLRVAQEVKAPLQANLAEVSKTPMIPFKELHEIGFKLISYSGTTQRAAIRGMQKVLDVLKKEGTTKALYPADICSTLERSELLGLQDFYELEERLYGPLLDTEGSWRKELAEKATKSDRFSSTPKRGRDLPI